MLHRRWKKNDVTQSGTPGAWNDETSNEDLQKKWWHTHTLQKWIAENASVIIIIVVEGEIARSVYGVLECNARAREV